jgi:hypothetical protein
LYKCVVLLSNQLARRKFARTCLCLRRSSRNSNGGDHARIVIKHWHVYLDLAFYSVEGSALRTSVTKSNYDVVSASDRRAATLYIEPLINSCISDVWIVNLFGTCRSHLQRSKQREALKLYMLYCETLLALLRNVTNACFHPVAAELLFSSPTPNQAALEAPASTTGTTIISKSTGAVRRTLWNTRHVPKMMLTLLQDLARCKNMMKS